MGADPDDGDQKERLVATALKLGSWIVLVGLFTVAIGAPYEHPVSSRSIREAYFLGQGADEKLGRFLAEYVKHPPAPKRGPHVTEIEIRTPYHQVVRRAQLASVGYSAQQAEQDYHRKPDVIVVQVLISLTPTYQPRSPDFWRDFSIRFFQEKGVSPKKVSGKAGFDEGGGLAGAAVEFEFDPADVVSAPFRVEVLTPDSQRVEAEFDLGTLR